MARGTKEREVFHLNPGEKGWSLEREGGKRSLGSFGTKAEALEAGKERAKKSGLGQLIVHTEYTYGKDPRNKPG
jgi:hypothetical protein